MQPHLLSCSLCRNQAGAEAETILGNKDSEGSFPHSACKEADESFLQSPCLCHAIIVRGKCGNLRDAVLNIRELMLDFIAEILGL